MKKWPVLASDAEAETFVAGSDLTDYDPSEMIFMKFELNDVTLLDALQLPDELLSAVKMNADRIGIPYKMFIRRALERAVQNK